MLSCLQGFQWHSRKNKKKTVSRKEKKTGFFSKKPTNLKRFIKQSGHVSFFKQKIEHTR